MASSLMSRVRDFLETSKNAIVANINIPAKTTAYFRLNSDVIESCKLTAMAVMLAMISAAKKDLNRVDLKRCDGD